MSGIGSGDNGEFTFLDFLAMASFLIGIENLDMNLTQKDKQELEQALSEQMSVALTEIHQHLEEQDNKIDIILKLLKEKENAVDKET